MRQIDFVQRFQGFAELANINQSISFTKTAILRNRFLQRDGALGIIQTIGRFNKFANGKKMPLPFPDTVDSF